MAQPKYPVKTTMTSFRLVEALYERDGAGITELADHLDISKSAVHKHLHTLRELGYVVEEDDVFYPGLRFLDRGTQVQHGHPLYAAAEREVENLASTTGEWVALVTREGGWGVYLLTVNGSNGQDVTVREGSYFPPHENPAGKAILAHMPRDRIQSILSEHDVEFGPQLRSELRTIKDQQLAYEAAPNDEDTQWVAASILNSTESVVGAICVVGSTDRLSGKRLKEDVSGLVLSTARSIGNSC